MAQAPATAQIPTTTHAEAEPTGVSEAPTPPQPAGLPGLNPSKGNGGWQEARRRRGPTGLGGNRFTVILKGAEEMYMKEGITWVQEKIEKVTGKDTVV